MQKTHGNKMRKKKYWDRTLDPSPISIIIADVNDHSTKVVIDNIFPSHIRKIFSKVKDTTQVFEFGLVKLMPCITPFFAQKFGAN